MFQRFTSDEKVAEVEVLPWLVFRLAKAYYAVNSAYITSLSVFENVTKMPEAPQYIYGLVDLRGEIMPLIAMRLLFGMQSSIQEVDEFVQMLEDRKQDHVKWVTALEDAIISGKSFMLATDPHKCKFGMWYDDYKTQNHSISSCLRRIDEPHQKLHEQAIALEHARAKLEGAELKKAEQDILCKARDVYVPQIIAVLDDAKVIFKTSHKRMVITLSIDDVNVAILVDEVCSVEELNFLCDDEKLQKMYHTKHLTGIAKSKKDNGLIALINEKTIAALAKELDY